MEGGGGGGWFWVETGWVYSLMTMWMLELSIGAKEVEVVACVMSVQNWLDSAARFGVTS